MINRHFAGRAVANDRNGDIIRTGSPMSRNRGMGIC